MPDIADVISTYISAKDGNRPWLMHQAFTEDASLEMAVNTDTISFPSSAKGVDSITEILVRQFSCDHENVYTFCLSAPPDGFVRQFRCDWLVGMSRRDNGDVRVGFGHYEWSFAGSQRFLADGLKITIEEMPVVPPRHLPSIMNWLAELPYPWCSAKTAINEFPEVDELRSIFDFLRRTAG